MNKIFKINILVFFLSFSYCGFFDYYLKSSSELLVGKWTLYFDLNKINSDKERKLVGIWIVNENNTLLRQNTGGSTKKIDWVFNGDDLILTYSEEYNDWNFVGDDIVDNYRTIEKVEVND